MRRAREIAVTVGFVAFLAALGCYDWRLVPLIGGAGLGIAGVIGLMNGVNNK